MKNRLDISDSTAVSMLMKNLLDIIAERLCWGMGILRCVRKTYL